MTTDQEKDNVLNILYVRILRVFLLLVGAWPGDALGERLHWCLKFYGVYIPCQSAFEIYGEIYYMLTNDLDILSLGENAVLFLLTCVFFIRTMIPFLNGYKEVIRDFFMDFHLKHYKQKGINFVKVHDVVEKACLYCTIVMVIASLSACALFNLTPLFLNYRNGAFSPERKHNVTRYYAAIYITYPFLDTFDNIKSLTTFNLYASYLCTIAVIMLDLLVIIMAFHIIGHIVVLRKNLESISGPEKPESITFNRESITVIKHEVYTKEENRKIGFILKDSVDHHRVIVRFAYKMSTFFGFMLGFNYTFQMICLCILLLVSTQGGLAAMIRFGPLTIMIFAQLIQISVIFEIIGTVSEKLPDALYCIPWECLDVSNQRSVCILLHRLQRSIHVTAMGMTSIGVTTMAGIMKTTFSYFAFLRSLNE